MVDPDQPALNCMIWLSESDLIIAAVPTCMHTTSLKPFSAIWLHPWPHIGRVPPDSLKSAYSIKCLKNAPDDGIFYFAFLKNY